MSHDERYIHTDGGFILPDAVVAYMSRPLPRPNGGRARGDVYLASGAHFEVMMNAAEVMDKIEKYNGTEQDA